MNDECMAKLAEQWGKICQHYSVNDHVKAQNFIQQHSSVLVNEFYSNIVLEPEAADFFKDDIIQQREPYRVCRRVNILRDYSDEKTKLYPRN